MNEQEMIAAVKSIIDKVPGEIDRLARPRDCSESEWQQATHREKAFLSIKETINDNFAQCFKPHKKNEWRDLLLGILGVIFVATYYFQKNNINTSIIYIILGIIQAITLTLMGFLTVQIFNAKIGRITFFMFIIGSTIRLFLVLMYIFPM